MEVAKADSKRLCCLLSMVIVFIDFIGVYRYNQTFDDVANLDRFQAIVQKSLAMNDDFG